MIWNKTKAEDLGIKQITVEYFVPINRLRSESNSYLYFSDVHTVEAFTTEKGPMFRLTDLLGNTHIEENMEGFKSIPPKAGEAMVTLIQEFNLGTFAKLEF